MSASAMQGGHNKSQTFYQMYLTAGD